MLGVLPRGNACKSVCILTNLVSLKNTRAFGLVANIMALGKKVILFPIASYSCAQIAGITAPKKTNKTRKVTLGLVLCRGLGRVFKVVVVSGVLSVDAQLAVISCRAPLVSGFAPVAIVGVLT